MGPPVKGASANEEVALHGLRVADPAVESRVREFTVVLGRGIRATHAYVGDANARGADSISDGVYLDKGIQRQ